MTFAKMFQGFFRLTRVLYISRPASIADAGMIIWGVTTRADYGEATMSKFRRLLIVLLPARCATPDQIDQHKAALLASRNPPVPIGITQEKGISIASA